MNRRLVELALDKYGVTYQKIFEQQAGYRNKSFRVKTAAGDVNLIVFKSEPGILDKIRAADAVAELAASRGLPVRRCHDARILQMMQPSGRPHFARLYNYLPGATIPWEAYSKDHIKLLGWAMSDLHAATADFAGELPNAAGQNLALLRRMAHYFADSNVGNALDAKLGLVINQNIFGYLQSGLEQAAALPCQIPLHLDLVRSNVLFGRGGGHWQIGDLTLTGLIDFEKVARGSAVLDLARSYAFLLADVPRKTAAQIYKHLIISGYNKRGQSQINLGAKTTSNIFWRLVRFYLLHDFYKFLRHNPYQFLPENHHFCRTRDILITKNMLRYS